MSATVTSNEGPRRLTGDRIDELSLCPGELRTLLEPRNRIVDLALLQR